MPVGVWGRRLGGARPPERSALSAPGQAPKREETFGALELGKTIGDGFGESQTVLHALAHLDECIAQPVVAEPRCASLPSPKDVKGTAALSCPSRAHGI